MKRKVGTKAKGLVIKAEENELLQRTKDIILGKFKEKDLGGRPTVMTPQTLELLKAAFSIGASDEEACAYAKIAPATLYDYQKNTLGFSEEKEALKLQPLLRARQTVNSNLHEKDTAKWYLEKKKKDEFSSKSEISVDVNQEWRDLIEVLKGKKNPYEDV